MPVARHHGLQCPEHTDGAQSRGDKRVLADVDIVICRDEIELIHLRVDRKHRCGEPECNQRVRPENSCPCEPSRMFFDVEFVCGLLHRCSARNAWMVRAPASSGWRRWAASN